MNKRNFRELLEERQRLLHKKAIYDEIAEHLAKFMDTDTGPAKMGIRSDGGVMVVPQDCIDEERDAFLETVIKTQESIDKIEQSMVAEDEKTKQQTTEAEGVEKVRGKATNGKKRAPAGNPK
jgi:hypothetical protein